MIKECYDAGQRHFGENYVQQLTEKAPQVCILSILYISFINIIFILFFWIDLASF